MSERASKIFKNIQFVRRNYGRVDHSGQIRPHSKQEQDLAAKIHTIETDLEAYADGSLRSEDGNLRVEGGSE
jgi:hypothetical protein